MTTLPAAQPDIGSLHLSGGVSVIAGTAALAIAGILWFGGRHAEGRPYMPRLVVLLVMTGTAGLVLSPVGQWLKSIAAWVNQALASLTQRWTGTSIGGWLLGAVATFLLFASLKGRRADPWTLLWAVLVPLTVSAIPGPLGRGAATAVAAVVSVVAWPVGWAFGAVGA